MYRILITILLMFSGALLYSQVCDPPTAFFPEEGSVIRVCKGESVSLDGSGSFAAAGFNLDKYYWDYGDGSDLDSLSGASTSYSYSVDGNYRIILFVKDDNINTRCLNTNFSYVDILVAPDPIFSPMTVGGPICLGESVVLNAYPDQYSQEWNLDNYGTVQDPILEDNQNSQNTNSATVTGYNAGQTITNAGEIPDIFVNMEHEYMGDLTITIICPNGSSVLLHDGGGSSEALGVPVHDDFPHVNGVGFDYVWSPSATNGSWEDNATPNFGGNNSSPPLAPGTYESENPMNDLIGCDINGVWQFIIIDELGSDDGTLFNWGLTFPPSLFSGGITSFVPSVGLQADSSSWSSGPGAVISGDGNTATITPPSTGTHTYTYTITDNHGCTNDTTITFSVTPNPITTASADATICPNAPFQLDANVSPNPGSVVYTWTPGVTLSNPNIKNPIATTSVDATYTVQAYRTGHPLCYTEDQVTLTVEPIPLAGADNSIDYCQSDAAVDINTLLDATAAAGGVWFDSDGNTPATMFDPAVEETDTLIYVTGDAAVGCSDTAVIAIQVAIPFVLNQSNDTTICENGTAVLSVAPTGGIGAPYTETWSQGLVGNGAHNVSPLVNTCYDVFVTDVNGCVSQTETICVNVRPPLLLANSGNTSICLNTSTDLDVVVATGGNDGPYNYLWTEGANTVGSTSLVTVSPTELTQYCLTLSDGCESTPVTECLEVSMYNQPEAIFKADKVDGCYPIQVTFENNTDPSSFSTVLWDFGNGSTSSSLGDVTTVYGAPICYDVSLTVTSIDGCVDDSVIVDYICPFDYPTADFNMSPNPTTFFETNIALDNLSSSDVVINSWDFGSLALPVVSSEENPTARFPTETTGVYPVFLTVENANGCQNTITKELVINSVFTLYVPNAFSPNDDGENETFFVQGESISTEDFLLRVFDRNGTILFETSDISEHWNGTSKNGKALKNGVYIWKVEAKDIYTDEVKEMKGHISIIK